MTELDRILDTVMKDKAELIKKEAPDEDRDEFIASLREQQKKKIIDEIREKYKAELIEEANVEVKKRNKSPKNRRPKIFNVEWFFPCFYCWISC